ALVQFGHVGVEPIRIRHCRPVDEIPDRGPLRRGQNDGNQHGSDPNAPCDLRPNVFHVSLSFSAYQDVRAAFAASITAMISDCSQRLDAPSLIGRGMRPDAAARQTEGWEIPSISETSEAFSSGSTALALA